MTKLMIVELIQRNTQISIDIRQVLSVFNDRMKIANVRSVATHSAQREY